jgi:hypothetical protein
VYMVQYAVQMKKKLEAIKTQGCVCPGCGFDYSGCPDRALLIIFEKSHIHNSKCSLRNSKEYFWSCRPCNGGKQNKKCGIWLVPNNFNQLCRG